MKKYFTLLFMTSFSLSAISQDVKTSDDLTTIKPKHVYFTGGFDGNLISSSILEKGDGETKFTIPRYTAFLHLGVHMNYDFNNKVGFFVGLGTKNIGFIEKYPDYDSTVIRRTYTLGIPVGLKFGNFNKKNYFFVGGGVDMPFHFKEKGFVKRSKKEKKTEWFSDRTQALLPYGFIGANLNPGIALKLQYYPTNFLNPDFKQKTDVPGQFIKPYEGYNVNMIVLSLGIHINYTPKPYWN